MDNTFWDLIEAKQAGCRAVTDWLGRGDGDELFGYFCRPVLDFEHPGHLRDFFLTHGVRDPMVHEEGYGLYRAALLDALEVYPDVAETLSRVRGLGLKTGIVTDAYERDARDRLEVAGLHGLFDCVVAFETTRQRKPAPAPFRVALASLGVRPGEAVYVGDSLERDIEPAQRLGFFTVHAAYGDRNIGVQPDVTPDVRIDGIAQLVAVIEDLRQGTNWSSDVRARTNAALDPAVVEQLTDVLSAHFANGYRLNSPIELVRFQSFAIEDLGKEISLSDKELERYIAACGTAFNGKVYPVSAQAKERIKKLAEEYFADGARAIFFAEFYAKNENWLSGENVVSEDMLIEILRRLFPELSFTQNYFGYVDVSIFSVIESEILRVWGDEVLLTYKQLAERLQYIPLDRIKYALGQNGNFLWSIAETFSYVTRIDITEEERRAIREAAERKCNADGYVSITDLPFGEIEERNYELSITAVHNAVYRICLSDKFDKKGKIVMRKGDDCDALTILKKYCRTIDKCSFDHLLNIQKELTGEVHRWISLEAGNTILVRLDRETYVADRYVHFNADMIDEAIELFVQGDYLPLKSFTTFGAFPDCGQEWNMFLLESYCRRFSRRFRFDAPTVNSRNAGVVIRKSCGLNYTEIMTDAVANAGIPLKDTVIGKFLFKSGYTGRSTTAKVSEIIDKAKAIRERRD